MSFFGIVFLVVFYLFGLFLAMVAAFTKADDMHKAGWALLISAMFIHAFIAWSLVTWAA